MRVEVKVPQLPESVAEATLVNWHKKAGDRVKRDENLVDVETDKVVLELPAPVAGVLAEIRKGDGATVAGQEVIAVLDTDASAAAVAAPAAAPAPARAATPAAAAAPAAAAPAARTQLRLPCDAAPSAQRRSRCAEDDRRPGRERGGCRNRPRRAHHERRRVDRGERPKAQPGSIGAARWRQPAVAPSAHPKRHRPQRCRNAPEKSASRCRGCDSASAERLVQSQSTAAI
jgi:2-oxoglutarate dehydrogenase E2 component (dihydrolipoamide succinyltransferase)